MSITNNSSDNDGGGIYCTDNSNLALENVIISNNTAADSGGGIYCNNSNLALENVIISNNTAADSGGGILCYSSDLNLKNVIISNNNAYLGGGILCSYCTLILTDVTINENVANNSGGGIYFTNSNSSIENVTISSNTSNQGGGIYCNSSDPILRNVTLSNNTAADYGGGIFCSSVSNPELVNCILWNISTHEVFLNISSTIVISYSDIQGGESGIFNNNGSVYWLIGNIDSEPHFVDSLNGDFHLQWDSPCIDSGHPDLDGDGIAWLTDPDDQDPDGTRMDMGAYYHDQHLPKVDFTANVTSGLYPLTVQFTDLSTIGNLGTSIDSWSWDFDNDGIEDSYLQNPTYTYTLPGIYTVSLTVTDDGFEDTEIKEDYIGVDQEIVVTDIQPSPGIVTINEMETIDFFFSGYDPDGNTLDYSWNLDGVEVSIDSTYLFETNYTFAGLYLVTLDVTDNFTDNSIYYEWNVTVIDVDQEIVVNDIQPTPGSVTIDETETINFFIDAYDPDGNPLEYSWKLDGVEVSIVSTYDFITDYTSAGDYIVTLEVTDNFGTDRISRNVSRNTLNYLWNITVNDVDQEIIVNDIQPPPGTVTIDEMDTIDFYFIGYDPDGNSLAFSWKLDGVEVSVDSIYLFTTDYSSAGVYLVTLDVTDNFSNRKNTSRNELNYIWAVLVIDVDQEIIVNDIQPAPGPVTIDELDTINFYFSGYDPDGNPLEYSWELDGVEVSTDSTYTFETDYTSAGEYVVTLEVTDNFGTRRISGASRNTLNYSWDVTVNDVDQLIVVNELIPPEGDITIDEGDVINFSIDAYDPDGNDLDYSWQVDGVEVSIESSFDFITDENSAGEYEVTLFVTDNFGSRDELNFLWNVTVNDVVGSGVVLIPTITKLYQNFPNPFNPITNIQFDIKENETGVLSIYNIKGQMIESQQFVAGQHVFQWDASEQSSGVYLYKLQTESFTEIRKMILLK